MNISISTVLLMVSIQVILFILLAFVSTKLINYGYSRLFRGVAFLLVLVVSSFIGFRLLGTDMIVSTFIVVVLINMTLTILIEISFIDFKYFEIPDSYNIALSVIGLASLLIIHFKIQPIYGINTNHIFPAIAIGFIMFVLYFVLAIFTGGGLGMGDVKMILGIGLITSSSTILWAVCNSRELNSFLTVFRILFKESVLYHAMYSFSLGALLSIFLLLLKVKGRKDKIAFGPYLALGTILLLFISEFSFLTL